MYIIAAPILLSRTSPPFPCHAHDETKMTARKAAVARDCTNGSASTAQNNPSHCLQRRIKLGPCRCALAQCSSQSLVLSKQCSASFA